LEETQHHHGLLMLFCVALCLSVYATAYALSLPPLKKKKGKRHDHPGTRLLQKAPIAKKSHHRFLSQTRDRKLD
jgi:hypothetical protein